MFFESSINWTFASIYVIAAWIGIFQGDSHNSLLDCYSPIKIAFDVLEPAEGTNKNASPIIFYHGIAATKESWYDIPQIVGDRTNRKVYVLDARNHGDSEYSECFNFDVTAADLLHFMDEQGIPRAVMIGFSLGAISAIKIAVTHPERVEKAFMEDMYVSRIPTKQLQNVAKYIELLEKAAEEVPADYNDTAAIHYVVDYVKDTEDIKRAATGTSTRQGSSGPLVELVKDENGKRRIKANIKVLSETFQSSEKTMSEIYGRYDGPAFFIYGTESTFRSDTDEEHIREVFPGVKLIPIEGSNHEVHAMFPEEFIEDVLRHLN